MHWMHVNTHSNHMYTMWCAVAAGGRTKPVALRGWPIHRHGPLQRLLTAARRVSRRLRVLPPFRLGTWCLPLPRWGQRAPA
jgi:hypothetical protein